MARSVKAEFVECAAAEASASASASASRAGDEEEVDELGRTERRALRSRYLEVKNLISDDRDDISNADSDKFSSIFSKVESLHQLVQKPREQVADAEALLEIASTLVTSVKAHRNEGITPSDFVSALLKNFGQQDVASSSQDPGPRISWSDIGLGVSHIFKDAPGCCTMFGPMNIEPKQRKAPASRKRTPAGAAARPEELEENEADKRTDTDKNVAVMFDILRKHRRVRLENLILNRVSFAQTVENIFALSFLVKDGRVEIKVNGKGQHMISPRNAPSAASVQSGQVSFGHFIFRFDFEDWKFMLETVPSGDELMPHRVASTVSGSSSQPSGDQGETQCEIPQSPPATPIRKLSRNRGLVMQDESVAEDLEVPETDDCHGNDQRKRKRIFRG